MASSVGGAWKRVARRARKIGQLISRAPEMALKVMEETRKEGIVMGNSAYEQAISRSRTPAIAWKVWTDMPSKTSRAATNVVLVYLRSEQLRACVDFLTDNPPVEPLPLAWRAAFRYAAEAKQLEIMNTLLKKMPENIREQDPVVLESLSIVFAELGELDELRTLLEQMADKQVKLTPAGCEKIMRQVAGHGDMELAMQIFERQRARRAFGYAVTPGMFDTVLHEMKSSSFEDMMRTAEDLVYAYRKSGSWLNAQHVTNTFKAHNLNPSDNMYRNLYKSLCGSRLTTKAEELLEQMKDDGVLLVPDDYAQLVRSYSRVCKVKEAEKLLGDLLVYGPPPTSEVYNALLEVYVWAGRDDLAELLFKEVQAISEAPGMINFALMMSLCTRYVRETKGLLGINLGYDLALHASNYGAAHLAPLMYMTPHPAAFFVVLWRLDRKRRQGRVADALQYFDAGVDLAAKGESLKKLYKALFNGLGYCGQLGRARAHVEKKIGWDGEWPQILLKHYAKHHETTRAMEFLREVLQRGNCVDHAVFSELILAHGRLLSHDSMWELLEIAKRVLGGTQVPLLNSIIKGYAESRHLKKTYEVFRMLGSDASLESYEALIVAHCKAGDMSHAERLVSAITEQGMRLTPFLCNSLLMGYFRGGRVWEAERLFAEMVAQGPTPNIYTFQVMIAGYGDTENVTRMKDIHRQLHESRSRLEINVVLETSFMDGLLKNGLVEEAEEIFEAMKAHGPAPNVRTYGALINRYYKSGMGERAEELFYELKDAECTVNCAIVFLMFKHRSMNGDWAGCFAILDELDALQLAPSERLIELFRQVCTWESAAGVDALKSRLAPYVAERQQVPGKAEHPLHEEHEARHEAGIGQLSESGLG